MKDKKAYIDKILEDVFKLKNSFIDISRKENLHDFIKLTINGDIPNAHLAVNASLNNGNEGTIVYILTNIRLIEIDIDKKEIWSSSFVLNSIIKIERKLLDDERIEIKVLFQNDSFGLRYPTSDTTASNFFQLLDQARLKGV